MASSRVPPKRRGSVTRVATKRARDFSKRAGPVRTFSAYQDVVEQTDEKKKRTISLLGLVGEVGDLHSTVKKMLLQSEHPSFRSELREELGDVLWYLTSLAALYKIPLEEIAQANAEKAVTLYSEGSVQSFDRGFPSDERFPRQFRVSFIEKPIEGGVYVKITINGIAIGDALTDNAHEDDGYRFHDVFHFAYAAVLGWSPVVRALLKRKRKSRPRVDEVEDGARAAIVEEAISAFVFSQAPEPDWYKEESSIDLGLLKTVRRLTPGFEVRSCTAKQWRQAILEGFSAFLRLREENGGDIDVDLDRQSVTFISTQPRGLSG